MADGSVARLAETAAEHADLLARSEAAVRSALVEPVLRLLGWDPADPSQVEPERDVGRDDKGSVRRTDYALLDDQGQVWAVVEAKPLGEWSEAKADRAHEQAAYDAVKAGARLSVATDGLRWEVACAALNAGLRGNTLARWKLEDGDPPDEWISALLGREQVTTGEAQATLNKALADARWRSVATHLPGLWRELRRTADEALCQALEEAAGRRGLAPSREEVEAVVSRGAIAKARRPPKERQAQYRHALAGLAEGTELHLWGNEQVQAKTSGRRDVRIHREDGSWSEPMSTTSAAQQWGHTAAGPRCWIIADGSGETLNDRRQRLNP